MTSAAIFLPSMGELLGRYDAFVLDLWGVVHDGRNLYPGALETLQRLRSAGKKITFLSNAPRRATVVRDALKAMGVGEELYDAIITSGEAAYRSLQHPEHLFFTPRGNQYIYIGLERDRLILDGLDYKQVQRPADAQFMLVSHSFEDNQPLEQLKPLLQKCAALKLPLVCINPDMEVVRITGERVYCAGVIAQEYAIMGGQLMYFGKAHPNVYELALATFGPIDHGRIVAVGDSMGTDILGGNRASIATALVAGGILKEALGDYGSAECKNKLERLCSEYEAAPNYMVPEFRF